MAKVCIPMAFNEMKEKCLCFAIDPQKKMCAHLAKTVKLLDSRSDIKTQYTTSGRVIPYE